MTVEEYHLLAAIVYLEAGNQSATGQRAVVEVVFNRVLDPRFPSTVKGVLSQSDPVQFSTWKNRANAQPTQEQYDAIDATLLTTEPILLPEVLYFASVDMNRTRYERIGNHNFYIG
jgi:N-acetylmuramoyl-L-alanine amidase